MDHGDLLDAAVAAALTCTKLQTPETAPWEDWPPEEQDLFRSTIAAALHEALETNRSLHRRVQRAESRAAKRCTALIRERNSYARKWRTVATEAIVWKASADATLRAYTELRRRGFWARVFG
jgi:hypothetical protein